MKKIGTILTGMFLLSGCGSSTGTIDETAETRTPVTIVNVTRQAIEENIELNAVSQFQKKIPVRATVTGYISDKTISIGSNVDAGQTLFRLMTREAYALRSGHNPDTSLHFSGIIDLKAQTNGIVTSLSHQAGDYVQEGDELAVISEPGSLVFVLQVPFEMGAFIKTGGSCEIVLPGNTIIQGTITGSLPEVDATAQTQQYLVKPQTAQPIPENLVAKVRIVKARKENATVIPKAALLTDDAQTEFWVMKLLNDSVAVKTIVTKGIEEKDTVEIIEPQFPEETRLLLEGNYGLPDTAKVIIRSK